MGFFAEAGPLQIFVSNHLIPEEFEFDTTNDPCYITADGEQKITPGGEVRLRIVGTRVDANEIVRRSLFQMLLLMPGAAVTMSITHISVYIPHMQFAVATLKDDYLGVIAVAA